MVKYQPPRAVQKISSAAERVAFYGPDGVKLTSKAGFTFDPATDRLSIPAGGLFGLGTATVPHGGVGYARLAMDGVNGNAAGPHAQFTTDSDDYPLLQMLNWTHDNVNLMFDCYYDGSFRSAHSGSNFAIKKRSDEFRIQYASGVAAGGGITLLTALAVTKTGVVNVERYLGLDGDGDTYRDLTTDQFADFAGGVEYIRGTESTTDELFLNPTGADINVSIQDATGTDIFKSDAGVGSLVLSKASGWLAFFGGSVAQRRAAYTQTHSFADRTLSAYTSDTESTAYTGLGSLEPGSPYASVADLNALRSAYENLRGFVEDLAGVVNSHTDDFQAFNLCA